MRRFLRNTWPNNLIWTNKKMEAPWDANLPKTICQQTAAKAWLPNPGPVQTYHHSFLTKRLRAIVSPILCFVYDSSRTYTSYVTHKECHQDDRERAYVLTIYCGTGWIAFLFLKAHCPIPVNDWCLHIGHGWVNLAECRNSKGPQECLWWCSAWGWQGLLGGGEVGKLSDPFNPSLKDWR